MEKLYEKKEGQLSWKSLLPIGLITIFVFAFAQIYGLFSHGVYSAFMSYAFLLPLTLIFLPKFINLCTGNRLWNLSLENGDEAGEKKLFFTSLAFFLWKSGVAVLTVGSIYKGVLDIYGTSGSFEWVYLVVGIFGINCRRNRCFVGKERISYKGKWKRACRVRQALFSRWK